MSTTQPLEHFTEVAGTVSWQLGVWKLPTALDIVIKASAAHASSSKHLELQHLLTSSHEAYYYTSVAPSTR